MDHMEMVERLRAKANVSYEEARAALEKTNWDLLDAMVELERQGKVRAGAAAYDTASDAGERYQPVNATASVKRENKGWKNFCDWFKTLLRKSWHNSFCISRNGEVVASMPILLFALLVFFCFWVVFPVMLVGLFFSCRYSFRGEDIRSEDVNNVISKATDCAENIKKDIMSNAESGEHTPQN